MNFFNNRNKINLEKRLIGAIDNNYTQDVKRILQDATKNKIILI